MLTQGRQGNRLKLETILIVCGYNQKVLINILQISISNLRLMFYYKFGAEFVKRK